MSKPKRKCLLAVRVRGVISASKDVRATLKMLNMKRNNHAVLIDDRPAYLGMLKEVQNYVTWGEPTKETVRMLIEKRGRLVGDKRISEDYVKKLGYKSLDELVEAVYNCSVSYGKLPGVKPYFRLHPPSKGFKGKVKKSYQAGGEAGYRGEAINELVQRMI
ncbi:MAG TPA: 50S ribosomal protein L30 [Candidatus Bathyarchaeota archaeon]|nr:MAG: 50S ribosomal protein L30 [Candidatus Bathyarchaeota archaeon]RLI27846.1 MAG: 50S ribosomal protein L30 [Candidatus Bathyarchaeota archaeon]HDI07719.1 50S ribosomal protein L30 [Candidatus Bathyarchaeota archaeon]